MSDILYYQFQLNSFSLNITEKNILKLNSFILKSGFHHITSLRLSTILNELSNDSLITKQQYLLGIEKLLLGNYLSPNDRKECTELLLLIFDSYDRTESRVVDVIDLICGLSILCEGSKSMKLAFAFDLMDEDHDGILTKRGLWRYFRAFLATLMTITGATENYSCIEITTLCDDCAVWTASQLLTFLKIHSNNSNIIQNGSTFKNLADWYTQGGYQISTWLELLDLSKWLPLRPIQPSATSPSRTQHQYIQEQDAKQQQQHQQHQLFQNNFDDYENENEQDQNDEDGDKNDNENDDENENEIVVPENPYVDEDGVEIFHSDLYDDVFLSLRESDSSFVLQVSQLTGFYNMTPQLIIEKLQSFSFDNVITIGEYNSFVSSTVPANLTDEELAKVSFALSSIYYAYDDEGDSLASTTALASGLSIFTKGSKSSKLSACFHLCDSDKDGYLTLEELQTYLGSFLRMLLGCSFSTASQRGYGVTTEIVTRTCQTLAREISENYQIKLIDFQTFGDWYNEGGYKIIPWIELIDMSKWVKITAVNSVSRSNNNYNNNIPTNKTSSKGKSNPNTLQEKYTSNIVDPDDNRNNNGYYNQVQTRNGYENEDNDEDNNEDDDNDDYENGKVNQTNKNKYNSTISNKNNSDGPAFTLILYKRNGQYVVSILPDTVNAVLELSMNSGLSKMDSEKINQVILDSCNTDLLLNRKEFDRFIHRIHPHRRKQYHADISARAKRGEVPTSPFSEKNMDAFSSLFNSYDRTGKGVVDAIEIAIGLGTLCSGSKSVKLATAFDLLDEDRDGLLSRRGVWRFFRSFLLALLTLSGTAQTLSSDEIIRIADSTALYACDSVLQTIHMNKLSELQQPIVGVGITFDDIADWYTSIGYRIAPWLELLDLSKWNQLISN